MSKCANCNELVGEEWSANNGLCTTCVRDEVSKEDANQASELYELCKEVYEKTGWIVGDESWDWHTTTDAKLDSMFIAPKYYTDYLLERLQSWFYAMGANDFGQFGITMLGDGCIAKINSYDEEFSEQAVGDTPLKSLLKLTIALSEAGELK